MSLMKKTCKECRKVFIGEEWQKVCKECKEKVKEQNVFVSDDTGEK